MKRLALLLVLILSLLPIVGAHSATGQNQQVMVLIVMSPSAYAYHSHACRAVKRATHEIKSVTLHDAITKYKRTPCGYCYPGQ